MTHEPLVVTVQSEAAVELTPPSSELPAPSHHQERLADEVFSRDQSQVASTLLALQTGLMIAQHIVAETFPPRTSEEAPPRRKPDAEPAV